MSKRFTSRNQAAKQDGCPDTTVDIEDIDLTISSYGYDDKAIVARGQTKCNRKWEPTKESTSMCGDPELAIIVVFSLVFVLLAVSPLFISVYTAHVMPCMYMESFEVTTPLYINYAKFPSSKSKSSTLSGSWSISLGFHNHGHGEIIYDNITAEIYYNRAVLGNTTISITDLHQGPSQIWANMTARINATTEPLEDVFAYTLAQDMNDRIAIFRLEVVVYVRVISNWFFRKQTRLYYYISDTSYPIPCCNPIW